MTTLLLVIIYISFISLGLPDALLGGVWPVMQAELSLPVSYAGLISLIITAGTVVSSLMCERVTRRFGAGRVTAFSVFLTAAALLGNSISPSFFWLCLCAVPMGLGAGAVDSVLNNFVALHYKARHMAWLHCFWGLGATSGPIILSFSLSLGGWRSGYRSISIIQFCIVGILVVSLPLWKKVGGEVPTPAPGDTPAHHSIRELTRVRGVWAAMASFFCYCSAELTIGLWGSTFLVSHKGIPAEQAIQWIAMFYTGITIGRFLTGFVTMRLVNRNVIRLGIGISFIGMLLLFVPGVPELNILSLLLIGLGFAPVFPCMLHETPARFGRDLSQSLIGLQMASAYVGNTLSPPLFGLAAKSFGAFLLPYFLCALTVLLFIATEAANRTSRQSPDVEL